MPSKRNRTQSFTGVAACLFGRVATNFGLFITGVCMGLLKAKPLGGRAFAISSLTTGLLTIIFGPELTGRLVTGLFVIVGLFVGGAFVVLLKGFLVGFCGFLNELWIGLREALLDGKRARTMRSSSFSVDSFSCEVTHPPR